MLNYCCFLLFDHSINNLYVVFTILAILYYSIKYYIELPSQNGVPMDTYCIIN